jgi:hypothetical protein
LWNPLIGEKIKIEILLKIKKVIRARRATKFEDDPSTNHEISNARVKIEAPPKNAKWHFFAIHVCQLWL